MSGPSSCKTPFDFAAAPLSCSRSRVPTFGISRSIMNRLTVMNVSAQEPPPPWTSQSSDPNHSGKAASGRYVGLFRPLFAEIARQMTGYACAASVAGFQFHPAAVQLDKTVDESEAQPCPRPRNGVALCRKALKYGGHHIGRYARTCVLDPDAHILALDFAAESHRAAARRIFERVRDQIEHHLLEPASIGNEYPVVFLAIELER